MAILEVSDLKKSFVAPDGERTPVVDIPSFSMAAGEHVALQGGSGTGKTTFLNLLAGILQADSGRVLVAGEDLVRCTEPQRDRLRALNIGYVFQTFNLLQAYTALENVALGMLFGRGAEPEFARMLLQRVGLSERMNYRPAQLSVGQQQRVAVARALANRPKLVLADEPTGNLDPHHAREALGLIREICRENGAALLLVSHDREILSSFEQVTPLSEINRGGAAHG